MIHVTVSVCSASLIFMDSSQVFPRHPLITPALSIPTRIITVLLRVLQPPIPVLRRWRYFGLLYPVDLFCCFNCIPHNDSEIFSDRFFVGSLDIISFLHIPGMTGFSQKRHGPVCDVEDNIREPDGDLHFPAAVTEKDD